MIKRPDIDVNKMTSGKKTALYVAIERGFYDCVKLILKRCKLVDLYLETSFSTTPLYIAQRKGDRETIKLMMLVGKAANFNYCDSIDQEKISENKSQQFIIMSEIPRFL